MLYQFIVHRSGVQEAMGINPLEVLSRIKEIISEEVKMLVAYFSTLLMGEQGTILLE